MENITRWIGGILLLLGTLTAQNLPENHIVQSDWLAKHLKEKSLVVIDTRRPEAYRKGHIEGAVNLPKAEYFKGHVGNIPKWPDTPEQLQDRLQKAGVGPESLVIFYSGGKDQKDFADAASGLWNLWIYGLRKTAILDGGFAKWSAEKRPVSTETPNPAPSDLEIETFDKSAFASLVDVMEAIYDEDLQIADARVGKFYRGEDKRKDLPRHGRIPTAKLTPVIRYVRDNGGKYYTFLSAKEARKMLHNNGYGVELEKPLILYCNTGHKARGLWFVATFIAGINNVRVYDGSMVEYSRSSLPVESGEPMD